jgi:two-component system, OmpR family, response regulator
MSKPESILIVDDDRDIRQLLVQYLEKNGMTAIAAGDGAGLRREMARHPVDLIVLDLNLPGEDGLALCRSLRAMSTIPIVMLTARGEPVDRIIGLEMGADDYLAKPFEPRELLARIRSVLRRAVALPANLEPLTAKQYRFAGWTLDLEQRNLERNGGALVMLSGAEFRMLKVLLEHANRVLSREQLMKLAKGRDADVFDRAIDLQISRLRDKLGDDAKTPTLIKTVRSEGYVLSASVETITGAQP